MEQLNTEQFDTLSRMVEIPSWRSDIDPFADELEMFKYLEEEVAKCPDCTFQKQEFVSRSLDQVVVYMKLPGPDGSGETMTKVCSVPISALHEGHKKDSILKRFAEDPRCVIKLEPKEIPSWNLIVEKGTGTEFTVMVYVHIDSVEPADLQSEKKKEKWQWGKLTRDAGYLKGLGAYDMKGGAMVAMDLLRHVRVPNGMKLVVVFSPDEEGNSQGAQQLLSWPGMHTVDLVLSPEIATIYNRSEADDPKDIITARVGHAKTVAEFEVPQTHAFRKHVPEAEEALAEMRNHLKGTFYAGDRKPHEYFGPEVLEELKIKEVTVKRAPGFSNTTYGHFGISQFILPGNAVLSAYEAQSACMERLAGEREWAKKGIQYRLAIDPKLTSYEPYVVPMGTKLAKAVVSGVDKKYGAHKMKGGRSTSDMNVFMPWFIKRGRTIPCVEVGPMGLGAHSVLEAVVERSLVRLIDWHHFMIQEHLPEFLHQMRSEHDRPLWEDDNGPTNHA
jgi:acetylornithine deacetylase/succinyl-diaminopimelate desuccinylase-like protein